MFKKALSLGVTVAATAVVIGCSLADGPTAPQSATGATASNSLIGTLNGATNPVNNLLSMLLVRCERLPVQTASKTIGRSGGTINIGPHTLVIPAGALSGDTRITAKLPGDNVSSVIFAPEGLRFAKRASLTLSYAHCRKLLPLPTQIAYTTDDLQLLELLRSTDNRAAKKVSASLDHFSRYAVAWRGAPPRDEAGDEDAFDGGSDGDYVYSDWTDR